MTLPIANNTISILDIRNEAYNQGSPNPTPYGTSNSDLMNIGFYRDKYYFVASNTTYVKFPDTSSPISIHDFHGKGFNCNCNCVCDCNCLCGDGNGE
jgi:hypothetical protein